MKWIITCVVVLAASLPAIGASDDWLAMGDQFAQADASATTAPTDASVTSAPAECPPQAQVEPAPSSDLPYWALRSGPSQPGLVWPSVKDDILTYPAQFWDDTKATFTNRTSLALLAAAAVSGALIAGTDLDDDVEDEFSYDEGHGSLLNTEWDSVGGFGGSPATHFVIAGAWYAASLWQEDYKNYERSKTLINTLAVNGAVTMVLKLALRTESPNGDEMGWPSGHTSSSFAFATYLANEYGPWVGVPAYAFAAFVGYERVDARNHDFSDVISGAFIGIAVGHAVYRNHQPKVLGMDIIPYVHPEGAVGIALCKEF